MYYVPGGQIFLVEQRFIHSSSLGGMYRVFRGPVLLFIVHAHFATNTLIMLRSIYLSTKPTRTIAHNTASVSGMYTR